MFTPKSTALYLLQTEQQLEEDTGYGFEDFADCAALAKRLVESGDVVLLSRVNEDYLGQGVTRGQEKLS